MRWACLGLFVSCLPACAPAQVTGPEPYFAKLYEDLKSEDVNTRYKALEALRNAKPPAREAIPVLTGLLKSDDVLFRRAIANLLLEVAGEDNRDALQSLAQIEKDNRLVEAVWEGDLAKVKQALKDGASPSARYLDYNAFLSSGRTNYTPLMAAALGDKADILKTLLEHKPDLEAKRNGKTALYYAVRMKHEAIVELLKVARAQGDPKKIALAEAMILAACRGYEMVPGEGFPAFPGVPRDLSEAQAVEKVVAEGGDANQADPQGYTPLMYAANLGLVENVKALLAQGARATTKGPGEVTAQALAEAGRERLAALPEDTLGGKGEGDGGNIQRVYRTPAVDAKVKAYDAVIQALKAAAEKEGR